MFKNETHNHPTEIEPFGGAATCLGGAIRDPLSGRSYVYQAMRVTGAGDPTVPLSRDPRTASCRSASCHQTAAAGYSSYGNQIGLATGHGTRDLPSGLCRKAHGDRRGSRRGSGWRTSSARYPSRATSSSCSAARPAATAAAARPAPPRPTLRNRSKPAARRCRRATRRRSARSSACSATAKVTRMIQALQRLRRGRRIRCHRRAGRRSGHRPERRAEEVRRSGRHRAGHLRIAGAHGCRRPRKRT